MSDLLQRLEHRQEELATTVRRLQVEKAQIDMAVTRLRIGAWSEAEILAVLDKHGIDVGADLIVVTEGR